MAPTLHLIPSPLFEGGSAAILTPVIAGIVPQLTFVISENARTTRRVLPSLGWTAPLATLEVREIGKHSKRRDIEAAADALLSHEHAALMSEAGCPCIADPGVEIVRRCHTRSIKVRPHGAATALMLALMGSGLNGQHFTFHGYLPTDHDARQKQLRELEADSLRTGAAQIFIETPYRSAKLFQHLTQELSPTTDLCIAQNLTDEVNEFISTRRTKQWQSVTIVDAPTVFIFQARR